MINAAIIFASFLTVLFAEPSYVHAEEKRNSFEERGHIFDRNGVPLAYNYSLEVLYANPKEIIDKPLAAKHLSNLFPWISEKSLLDTLRTDESKIEVVQGLSKTELSAVQQLKIRGLETETKHQRSYTRPEVFSSLVGEVSTENEGIRGLERSMQKTLEAGEDITLSIDADVQEITYGLLIKQIDAFEALTGSGVILDIETGEIITAVSSNPNIVEGFEWVYEPGATLQVINAAIALETDAVTVDEEFDVATPLNLHGFSIRDYWPQERMLNIPEIVVYSSNVGSAKIASKIPISIQKEFLKELGLADRIEIEYPSTGTPLLPSVHGQLARAAISFGHGISVPLLNLTSAIATASGDGYFRKPSLLKKTNSESVRTKRVFSRDTVDKVRKMLRWNVIDSEGTANFADAPGFAVGAKTGTAERIINGKYSKDVHNTFIVGIFPVDKPKYAFSFIIQEPKGQRFSYGYATSGWVTAPLVANVINQIAPILSVKKTTAPRMDEVAIGERRLTFDISEQLKTRLMLNSQKDEQVEQKLNAALNLHYGPENQRDYFGALEIYENILSDELYAPALVQMGVLHKHGKGVEINLARSYSYFEKALELEPNNVLANFYSADFFLYGLSIQRDVSEAIRRYTKAALKGETRAALKLADIYEFGMGVKSNKTRAETWLEVAAQSFQQTGPLALKAERLDAINFAKLRLQTLIEEKLGSSKETIFGRRVALLIGTEKYEHFQNLKTPVNDVNALGKVLSNEFGYEIKKLLNPDRKTITTTLNSLVRELEPEDNLLIFYAGHGKEVEGDGFWIPADADADDDTNWLSNDYITRKLKNFKSRNVLVISDSCYSGTLSRGIRFSKKERNEKLSSDSVSTYLNTKSRVVITSGNLEPVLDGGGGKNSIFARALIEALLNINDTVSATSLFSEISPIVIEDSSSLGFKQVPTIAGLNQAGHLGPDYVFLKN